MEIWANGKRFRFFFFARLTQPPLFSILALSYHVFRSTLFKPLHGHQLPRVLVAAPEHGPVGALSELAELLVGLEGVFVWEFGEEKKSENSLSFQEKNAAASMKKCLCKRHIGALLTPSRRSLPSSSTIPPPPRKDKFQGSHAGANKGTNEGAWKRQRRTAVVEVFF